MDVIYRAALHFGLRRTPSMTSSAIPIGVPAHRPAQRAGAFLLALALLSTAVVLTPATAEAAHVPNIPIGSLTNFSVLASTMITDTGGTSHFSDGAGVSPGVTITGIDQSDLDSGGIHINDTAAQQAQTDLLAAYTAAAALPYTFVSAALGGTTLLEGVYQPDAAALGLTGTLTLDGNGDPSSVFIIRTDGAFDTAAASTVTLINGAQECNVFWLVAGAVTLGADSEFSGTLLAQGAVTVGNAVNFHGRAFTRAGAVTLSDNEFSEPTCVGVTVTPTSGLVTTETGATATFTVKLDSQPSGTVTIGVSSSDPTEGTVSTPTLTFTTGDWNTAQTVTSPGSTTPWWTERSATPSSWHRPPAATTPASTRPTWQSPTPTTTRLPRRPSPHSRGPDWSTPRLRVPRPLQPPASPM